MLQSRYLSATWLDPALELRDSAIHGKGLFTAAPIHAGEVVLIWGGTLYTAQQLHDIRAGRLRVPEFSYVFVEEDLLLAAQVGGLDYYINHACDPNVWMADNVTLVARRGIRPGEEITCDYAVWEGDLSYVLEPCRCGSPHCRQRITGGDWMLPEVQERYAGHFVPYLSRRIARIAGGARIASSAIPEEA